MFRTVLAVTALTLLTVSCIQKTKNSGSPPLSAPALDSTASENKPIPTKAQAVIKSASGQKIKGIVHFTESNGKLNVEVLIEGLKPGPHGFHIHEKGDCTAKDFASAGGHLNPDQHQHSGPNNQERHAGDLGNIMANRKGIANEKIQFSGVTLGDGPKGIIGKSVIVHQDPDDLKSQPAGNSGKRIGCGVIEPL